MNFIREGLYRVETKTAVVGHGDGRLVLFIGYEVDILFGGRRATRPTLTHIYN